MSCIHVKGIPSTYCHLYQTNATGHNERCKGNMCRIILKDHFIHLWTWSLPLYYTDCIENHCIVPYTSCNTFNFSVFYSLSMFEKYTNRTHKKTYYIKIPLKYLKPLRFEQKVCTLMHEYCLFQNKRPTNIMPPLYSLPGMVLYMMVSRTHTVAFVMVILKRANQLFLGKNFTYFG